MADKKTDRRTMKTRKAIFESLAELLTQKELRNITVQELSDRADIHRVTFYKHFVDIYDVYEQLEDVILTDFGYLLSQLGDNATAEVYAAVFTYIKEHPKYFKMIFSPHSTSTLYLKILKMVEGLNRVIWAENFGVEMDDSRIDSAIRYHSNGTLAIIAGWVLSDFAHSDDDITKTLSGLDKSTLEYVKKQIG